LANGELSGRIAMVTGASRGIGAGTARQLAAAGAKVIVTDMLDCSEIAAEVGGIAVKHDVTDEAQWAAAMEVAKGAGGLDILVNNAGIFFMKTLTETGLDDWRKMFAVNVEGVFLGCKYAVPLMAQRASQWKGGASIVNLSSVAGFRGGPAMSAYSASKGAVRLLTQSLARELAPAKIRVNSIHPGLIATDMGRDLVTQVSQRSNSGQEEAHRRAMSGHAIARDGDPSEIGDAVVYLSSDRASFVTGVGLPVDGGTMA
jgi:NAD(P)-dependent dehydrogenase (short-subunit alcohol dehydrogenase family)